MCQTKILSQHGDTHISMCPNCQTYYIWQRNFVLTFNRKKFQDFMRITEAKEQDAFFASFPDDAFRLIVKTPYPDIVFSFDEEEWGNFKTALTESFYMAELYELLNK